MDQNQVNISYDISLNIANNMDFEKKSGKYLC